MILHDLIHAALKEDMPKGDVTTESMAVGPRLGRAKLKAKSDLVLSGTACFEQTLMALEPEAKIKWHFEEGQMILSGQNVCTINCDLIQLLKAERVGLNFLMHLSGIATYTRKFVDAVKSAHPIKQTQILDTRKTLPGYRELEKRAVVHGGGLNHRLNLSTAVLVKDNHIAVLKGISPAVERIREHTKLPIEVEVRTIEDMQECIDLKIERVLLDNMNNELMKSCMDLVAKSPMSGKMQFEASGNMSLERVRGVAALGVDFISVGALTHSAPSADLSLMFDWENIN